MSISRSTCLKSNPNKSTYDQFYLGTVFRFLAFTGFILFVLYAAMFKPFKYQVSDFIARDQQKVVAVTQSFGDDSGLLNISHIVFGLLGSANAWKHRKAYIESWWQPNITRGYLLLDKPPSEEFIPWPTSSPPFRISEDVAKFRIEAKRQVHIRIVRGILETYRQGDENVRWYFMGDDDTIVFIDNLVRVLSKYDHTKYYYLGANSECVKSDFDFSFEMAFGGGGIVLSAALVKALATMLDSCIARYPDIWAADLMTQTCLSDIGVSLTLNRGFHQFDLHGDLSGLLSAHWNTPLVTLHHIDMVDPIFPSKNRPDSLNHLMKPAKRDQSRLMQQTICHHRGRNWSFTVSWGYSAHIYESILPRSFLRKPLETFKPWARAKPPLYVFNTRYLTGNPCDTPHVFFFDSIGSNTEGEVRTTYVRNSPRNLIPCSASGNHSAEPITKINVITPASGIQDGERECCDVNLDMDALEVAVIKYRKCTKDEIMA